MWGKNSRKKHADNGQGPPFTQLGDVGFGLEPAPPSSSFATNAFGAGNGMLGDAAPPPSLREIVKKRLLNDMIRNFAGEPAGVVLLVDKFTVRASAHH